MSEIGHENGQYLTVRDGVWHYLRRVPAEFAHLDKRGSIKLSTKVKVAKDRTGTKAGRVAAKLNETHEAYWTGLAENRAVEAERAYADAIRLARTFSLDYQTPTFTAQQPLLAVLERVEATNVQGRMDKPAARQAILGGVAKPRIMLSTLYSHYEAGQRIRISTKSRNQTRKFKSAKKRAVEILIEQLKADKPLDELTREDAIGYVEWWEDRILSGDVKIGTANKNISHIAGMIKSVSKRLKLRLDNVFGGLLIEGGKDGSRPPFPIEHIRKVILADGKLAALNDQARDAIYIIMETGARPSEILNLSEQRIILKGDIPYIRIKAEDAELKTDHSERDVPLVGMALEAMLRHPKGFPRYLDNADSFSATAMKHFKKHKLLPSEKHKIYSFRHSFKDRLKAVKAPEELIDELMGHSIDKPKYGDGYGLKVKLEYLQEIAFTSTESTRAAA
jgi:integrase